MLKFLIGAGLVIILAAGGVTHAQAASDGVYNLSAAEDNTFDGADANRLLSETAGEYQFDYGDDATVIFPLPWTFTFYGQPYNQIVADTNGNIWFGVADPQHVFPLALPLSTTGPVISAWNADLNSYYAGGVFVRNKGDRVVVEWQSETFVGAGYGQVGDVEAVIFQDGRIRVGYKSVATAIGEDSGNGISSGDGSNFLSISQEYGNVSGLAGRAFLFADIDSVTDSDGDGYSNADELAAGTDPDDPASLPALGLSVSPTSLTSGEQLELTLSLSTLPSFSSAAAIYVERIYDVNGNDRADEGEPVLNAFWVSDGTAPFTAYGPGDSDSAVDGAATVVLNGRNSLDLLHLPGNFVWRARTTTQSSETSQLVAAESFAQSVSGNVTRGGSVAAGQLVVLATGDGIMGQALTDANGNYSLEVIQPGNYRLYTIDPKGQEVTDLSTAQDLGLPAAAHLTGIDFALAPVSSSHLVSGTLSDGGRGLSGVLVEARDSAGLHLARTLTGSDGRYQLQLPAGSWTIGALADKDPGQSPSLQGAVGLEASIDVTVTSDPVSGLDLLASPAATILSGTVYDQFAVPLAGLQILADNSDPAATATAVSAADGSYQLPVVDGAWSLQLAPSTTRPRRLIGTRLSDLAVSGSPVTAQDLTVYPVTAWLRGGLLEDGSNTPIAGVTVYARSDDGTLLATSVTDASGSFDLPVNAGTWWLGAKTEDAGYLPTGDQALAIGAGQTLDNIQLLALRTQLHLVSPNGGGGAISSDKSDGVFTILATDPP